MQTPTPKHPLTTCLTTTIGVIVLASCAIGLVRLMVSPGLGQSTSAQVATLNTVVSPGAIDKVGPVATASAEPTADPATSSWERNRDLEVSRDNVQQSFERLGAQFGETTYLANGMPRIIGRLGATIMIELQGPSDRLMKASAIILTSPAMLDHTSEQLNVAATFMNLPSQCLRDWKNSDQWIGSQLKQSLAAYKNGKEYSQRKQFKDGSWITFENGDASALVGAGGFYITLTIGRD